MKWILLTIINEIFAQLETKIYLQADKSQTQHPPFEFPTGSHVYNFHEDCSLFHLLDHLPGLQNCIQSCLVVYHNSLNDTAL